MPTPEFLAGEDLPASKLNALNTIDTSWVPTLAAFATNPDLGSSPSQTSRIHLVGNLVNVWATIRFGSGSDPGSGTYQVPLPAAYPLHADLIDHTFGTWRGLDDSTAGRASGVVGIGVADQFFYFRNSEGGTGVASHNIPWTWADGDWIVFHATYLTDFGT